MKKWLLLLFIFLAVSICCLYLMIPNQIHIQQTLNLPVNAKGFTRNFADEKRWILWWPEKNGSTLKENGLPTLHFNNNTYSIREKRMSSFVLTVTGEKDSLLTELFFFPVKDDSMSLSWNASQVTSLNPVQRLQRYIRSKEIAKDLKTILQTLQKFYATEDNLYGLPIKKDKVSDSTLIATSATTKGYPGVDNIYKLIDKLQAFAKKNGAKQTGRPMLNITTADSITYRAQVALPVDKKLKDEGDIYYRWMLGGGNILVAEVTGGTHSLNKAFAEMENYIDDNRRTAPAIPFQSLMTDRRKEPDTGKWVTKLYWPVM
ncbi:MAG TPA: GyrI-like domain-containing protein [Flavisolibacter sp.]|nr:GyrI-like domain-containing protein [Flavisolibacter sp.]